MERVEQERMKTTYSVLSEMEETGVLDDAKKKGVVPTSAFNKCAYEVYLKYRENAKNKTQAVKDASIEVDLSERYMWDIIKNMES